MLSTQKDLFQFKCKQLEQKIGEDQESFRTLTEKYLGLQDELETRKSSICTDADYSLEPTQSSTSCLQRNKTNRKQLKDLSIAEVTQLLQKLKLGKYSHAFEQSNIDGVKLDTFHQSIDTLVEMDSNDAEKLKGYLLHSKDTGIDDSEDSGCPLM